MKKTTKENTKKREKEKDNNKKNEMSQGDKKGHMRNETKLWQRWIKGSSKHQPLENEGPILSKLVAGGKNKRKKNVKLWGKVATTMEFKKFKENIKIANEEELGQL